MMNEPGKPCRVCSDFQGWTKGVKSDIKKKPHPDSQSQTNKESTQHNSQASKDSGKIPDSSSKTNQLNNDSVLKTKTKMQCPPDYVELGNSTWSFLHSTAAYYPETPTESQKKHMTNLMGSVANLYPCHPCAEHMQQEIYKSPPTVNSNKDISQWLCSFHNEVNIMLGKPVFDCSRVLERWRDGPSDGSCD